jgi:hypothetical protein
MAITQVQEDFVSRFKAYMANAGAYAVIEGPGLTVNPDIG